MSNIDKRDGQVQRYANFGVDMMEWADGGYVKYSDYVALLDELEAKDQRIAELTESLTQTVSGYKSCLRTGHERILDLGGDCDSPEVMIAGNPDIQQAEKLIAAEAGKGEAS